MMLMLSSFHTLTLSFAVIDIKLSRMMRRLRECVNTAGSDSFSLIVVTTSSSCLTSQWHTLLRSRVSRAGGSTTKSLLYMRFLNCSKIH